MSTINQSTRLVKIGAEGQPNVYPVFLSTVRTENTQWSFPEEPDEALINSLGYFAVAAVDQPAGAVVTEGDPALDNGVWKQTWVVRAETPEEIAADLATKKTVMLDDINAKVAAALEKGFSFTFTEGAGHVQLRDGDRANITGSRVNADALTAESVTDAIVPFRDWENVTHMCTPLQIRALSDAAYTSYLTFLSIGWGLKDAVNAATTMEGLPVVPDEIVLPPPA
jgi:hypothetical protein